MEDIHIACEGCGNCKEAAATVCKYCGGIIGSTCDCQDYCADCDEWNCVKHFQAGQPQAAQVDNALDALRESFPHGHPEYIPTVLNDMELHSRKNEGYAGGGDPLGNFHRVASICRLYPGLDPGNPVVIALMYELKQLDCQLWSLSRGSEDSMEGFEKRGQDRSVYTVLERILYQEVQCG